MGPLKIYTTDKEQVSLFTFPLNNDYRILQFEMISEPQNP